MNRRTIFIVILVIAVAVGAYFYTTGALKLPGSGEEPESAAAAAAAPAPMPMPMPPPAPPQMQAPPPVQEVQEPVGSHPFAGDKFLVSGNDANAVIVPIENDNRFKIDTSGARTNDMMVTLEPVDDQENTYFIKSKGVGKYIKYSNNGFGYRSSKPTTYHYKIKLTPVGDKYAMSYTNNEGKQYFFGYDGDKMKSDTSVTEIISTGLVDLIDAEVAGFILPGHFGSDAENFREFGPGEDGDPIDDIQGCLSRFGEIDMDEEYKESLLSVAYNKEAEAPCRGVSPERLVLVRCEGAAGLGDHMCIDKTKDIKQGCLL
jgi:hypothetical protein